MTPIGRGLHFAHPGVGGRVGLRVIPDEVISAIRDRVDMVALVGEYVRLKKQGGNHIGLCPFHAEKTPSFSVHGRNRFFYCFGCHASGDPFGFLMQLEGMSFPQAARALAERTGVKVPDFEASVDPVERRARARREELCALMEEACRYYETQLVEHPAATVAREELERRGVARETAETFRLGFAPPAWDGLAGHLSAKRASMERAVEVGLLARRRDSAGFYDRFRGRLMFPVRELSGTVVAFSGRALGLDPGGRDRHEAGKGAGKDAGKEPKYINSPESPLYHKGSVLFGLHEGRVHVRRHGWALLCEGNFDLLALHQAGFQNAVAPLGTAFTAQQAKLLARFASRVTLLFDGDGAGVKAVQAAYPLLRQHQLVGRVAPMPPNEDPDSFVRSRGAEALRALIDASPGIVEFLIDVESEQAHADAAERAAAVERLGPVLAAVDNRVEIDMYIERIAQRFGVSDLTSLRQQLRRGVARQRRGARNPPAGDRATEEKSVLAPSHRSVKLPKLEKELLGVLLDRPALFKSPRADALQGLLTSPELADVFRAAAQAVREPAVRETGDIDITALLSRLEGHSVLPWLRGRLAINMYQDRDDAEEVLDKGIALLVKNNVERELPVLNRAIQSARRSGDDEQAVRLTRQRDALRRTVYEQSRRER